MTYGITFERLRDKATKPVPIDTDKLTLCDSEDGFDVKLATVESILSPVNLAIANLATTQGEHTTEIGTNNLAIASVTQNVSQAFAEISELKSSSIIVLDTPPASRADLSALEVGDLWHCSDASKPIKNFFFDGLSWLSEQIFTVSIPQDSVFVATTQLGGRFERVPFRRPNYDLLLLEWNTSGAHTGATSPSGSVSSNENYYICTLFAQTSGGGAPLSPEISFSLQGETYNDGNTGYFEKNVSINRLFTQTGEIAEGSNPLRIFSIGTDRIGNPHDIIFVNSFINFRVVAR